MHVGMLWYDGTKDEPLEQKIECAVAYYRNKYHQEPTLCLVNPAMIPAGELAPRMNGMEVRAYGPMLPGHLWVGVKMGCAATRMEDK